MIRVTSDPGCVFISDLTNGITIVLTREEAVQVHHDLELHVPVLATDEQVKAARERAIERVLSPIVREAREK